MEQVATLLILKLGDGQARIREAALGALINLSRYYYMLNQLGPPS
jgi:hypothetical protein